MNSTIQFLLNFLVNAVWQICLIFLLALLAERLTRSVTRVRHLVWVVALLAAFLLPAFSAINTLKPVSKMSEIREGQPVATAAVLTVENTQTAAPTPFQMPRLRIGPAVALILIAIALMVVAWGCSRLVRGLWRTRRLRASVFEFTPEKELREVIERCRRVFGVTRVRVVRTNRLQAPATIGVIAPLVIIPDELMGERDVNTLGAAVGHEFVHIMRRDYLLNLIYELILLPVSFHPAAVLIKRRITQTRELRCDELVAERLLQPEIYARSLVRLAGSALPLNRRAQTIIVGIADADILEVRVMSLLNRPKTNLRRTILLASAAALVFAVPCIAAAAFALDLELSLPAQEPEEVVKVRRRADSEPVERKLKEQTEQEARTLMQKIEIETDPAVKAQLQERLLKLKAEKAFHAITANGQEYTVTLQDNSLRRKIEAQDRSELAKAAKISMDQAIQIATSSTPGKVLQCSLVGEWDKETGEPTRRPLYHVMVLSGDDAEPVITHLWLSAIDGTVVKRENELRRTANPEMFSGGEMKRRRVQGGMLNSRALNLPKPEYPLIAMKAGAQGSVEVEVTIDETGQVIAAHALSGHPLLQAAAVSAARQAKFQPTSMNGDPVKVSGVLRYEFVAQ